MCGFFKKNCLGIQKFLLLIQSPLIFAAWSFGNSLSCHWNPEMGGCCAAETPCSQNIPPEFSSTSHGWGTSLLCLCLPPTSLCRCGFFNSVVVRLPVDLISDGSEWWLFYISFIYFFKTSFLDRGQGREKERKRNRMCGCLSRVPYWEPGLQPRHVPWLGIKLASLWFAGQCSIHWATPARAVLYFRCNFDVIVQRGEPGVLTLPSWPAFSFLCILITKENNTSH